MIRIIHCSVEDPFPYLRSRGVRYEESVTRVVAEIIADVKQRGDAALLESARRFDAPNLDSILVTDQEIAEAELAPHERQAIQVSYQRVLAFHSEQWLRLSRGWINESDRISDKRQVGWDRDGIGQRLRPMRAAGVYVPGGRAAYPSSVIMNAGPAQAAGVPTRIVTTPAGKEGKLHPAVLYALQVAGVSQAFKIGGAAAIAALALGTESVPRVDKIVGPGNKFVNEAKRQLWGTVGLDGYAGPSEVCVLADETAVASFAAADLLTQIEHAPDNAGFLVANSEGKAKEILAEVERQLEDAPRAEIMREALDKESAVFIAQDLEQAIEIVNEIAPEHLSIATADPEKVAQRIVNAGCILMGEWTPESAGDFAAGPSHTLPTATAARFGSPVNVLHFLKVQSLINLRKEELRELTEVIRTFGEMEGFPGHARGATIRF